MNNEAVVAKLANISKIEGADKIVSAQIILNNVPITQVVVGIDTKENTPIVYFDSNLSINQEVIEAIDKLSPFYNKEGFKSLGEYLARGNRVRCIKLKGVISNGLAIELDKFYQFYKTETEAKNILVEGYTFTNIGNLEICKKWLPPIKNSQSHKMKEKKGNKKLSRIIPEMFHFHIDTQQLKYNIHKINPEDIISVSRKIHGTSAIISNTKVLRELSLKDKIAKVLGIKVEIAEYDYLYASRTVIKNMDINSNSGFYKINLWEEIGKKEFYGKLNKGESIYYEIVGYIPNTDTFIQKNYDYGTSVGEYKIAVYRITYTNDDGKVFEYSWNSMKERCKELNVPMVEEFYFGRAKDLFPIEIDDNWQKNFLEQLKIKYLERECWDNICKKVPDEGIVIRKDTKDIEVYKLKSENFFVHESKAKEDENNIDIEETEQALEK